MRLVLAIGGAGKRPPVELSNAAPARSPSPSATLRSAAASPAAITSSDGVLTVREAADRVAATLALAADSPLPHLVASARTALGIASVGALKEDLREICAHRIGVVSRHQLAGCDTTPRRSSAAEL